MLVMFLCLWILSDVHALGHKPIPQLGCIHLYLSMPQGVLGTVMIFEEIMLCNDLQSVIPGGGPKRAGSLSMLY